MYKLEAIHLFEEEFEYAGTWWSVREKEKKKKTEEEVYSLIHNWSPLKIVQASC